MIRPDPSPLRWLIGVELARHRNAARVTLTEASAAVGISRAKLGHLETGRQHQDPDDIALLLKTYGAEQSDIERMITLTGYADEAGWWTGSARVVPDWLKTFVGLERIAEHEFTFEPLVVPGILQCRDYAAALTWASPRVPAEHADLVVDLRLARAQRLTDPERPLRLHAVIGEAAVRLRLGSERVRRAQREHLLAMAELPNIIIQVIKPEHGPHTSVTGPYVTLDFADVRSIAYVELHDGAVYVQEPGQIRTYQRAARELQQVALDPDESNAWIRSMIESDSGVST